MRGCVVGAKGTRKAACLVRLEPGDSCSSTREGVAGAHACCVAKVPTIASPFCWRAATVESGGAQRVDISSSTRRAAPRTTRSRPSREVTCSWSRSETHSNPLKSHAEIARWERLREPEIRSGGDVSHYHAHLGVPRGGGYVKTAPRSEEAGGHAAGIRSTSAGVDSQ